MSENERSQRKKFTVLFICLGVAIIAIAAVITVLLLPKTPEATVLNPINENVSEGKLVYDKAAIVLDRDSLQKEVDEMLEAVNDGYIRLRHKSEATSSDGESFECYIVNDEANKYDVYFNIYKDSTAKEQILLTGLIPPGSGLESFKSEIKLEPGTYEALLVVTQVEDDHVTIHGGQLFLTIDLTVSG